MKIDLELAKHNKEIIENTEKLIKEIIDANKKNISDIPIIPDHLQTIIIKGRKEVPLYDKDKWYILECSLDKFEQII